MGVFVLTITFTRLFSVQQAKSSRNYRRNSTISKPTVLPSKGTFYRGKPHSSLVRGKLCQDPTQDLRHLNFKVRITPPPSPPPPPSPLPPLFPLHFNDGKMAAGRASSSLGMDLSLPQGVVGWVSVLSLYPRSPLLSSRLSCHVMWQEMSCEAWKQGIKNRCKG